MPKLLTRSIAILGATMIAIPAYAGNTNPVPVQVDLTAMSAIGDMVTARTDKNDDVFIGCGTRNFDDGNGGIFSWAFCQADDGAGNSATCFTTNADLIKTIHAINDTSFITFSWSDDGQGNLNCERMGFSTQSFYLGKEVKGNK